MSSLSARVTRGLHRRPRARLALLLSGPVAWLLLAYLGSLISLFVTSLYRIDDAGDLQKSIGFSNFSRLLHTEVYRTVALRTIGIALAVTVIDVVLAVPVALFIAKIANPRWRSVLVTGVLVPLWASYLVKAYAWRTLLGSPGGVLDKTFGGSPGYSLASVIVVLAYLWLPYMILPVYAGLERLPDSLLEASGDLGAHFGRTIRSVVVPMLFPAIIAGSIFTFSLTLGDYIAVGLVGGSTQMIGTVVYSNFSVDLPFAAAFATVPVLIMVVYLFLVRRSGALENL